MKQFIISEMAGGAAEYARANGTGIEITAFCAAEAMDDGALIARKRALLRGLPFSSMHGCYYEMAPCAIDSMIRGVCMHRFLRAADVCREIGAQRLVLHSGYAPQVYYPVWFIEKSVPFWREFLAAQPRNFSLAIENVLDTEPTHLRDVIDGIGDPRAGVCLDVGHANVYSRVPPIEWVRALGSRIIHVHLHNNYGDRDTHNAPGDGNIPMDALTDALAEYAPNAVCCLETTVLPQDSNSPIQT